MSSYLKGVCQVCKAKELVTAPFWEAQHGGVHTFIPSYSPCPIGPVQPKVELHVIKCIVVTSSFTHRGQSFFTSLHLIAWNMLFLTFLCWGGAWGTGSCLSCPFWCFLWADRDFLAVVDQEFCHFPASRWATTMSSMSSSLPICPQKAATAASQSLCFLKMGLVMEKMGLSRHHRRGATCTVSSAGTSRHGLPCSLLLVKARKIHSSQLQQDIPTYCLESFPHKDWPNLTLISLSYLVSHVNMKGI